jgi:hypothetical protein
MIREGKYIDKSDHLIQQYYYTLTGVFPHASGDVACRKWTITLGP